MDENETSDSLSPEASAYFESRGETITAEPPPAPEPPQPAAQTDDLAAQQAIEGNQNSGGLDPRGLAAVREEREANKELRARIAEMDKRSAVLEDRWNMLLTMGQAQEQPQQPEAPPDPDQDIFAYARWQAQQVQALQERIQGRETAEQQAAEQQRVEQAVWGKWESDARAFAESTADFGDAAKWLSGFRDNQLQALSAADPRFADPAMRNWQIEQELRQVVVSAAQQGKSSAELIYGIAKGYGYKPAAPANPGAEIENLNKNQPAELSLSNMGGGAANKSGPKTAEDVANMSATEFDSWFKSAGDAGFRRIMGGAR